MVEKNQESDYSIAVIILLIAIIELSFLWFTFLRKFIYYVEAFCVYMCTQQYKMKKVVPMDSNIRNKNWAPHDDSWYSQLGDLE